MAGREQSDTSKPGMDPRLQGSQTHRNQADLAKEREQGAKIPDEVGRNPSGKEVPDSKETSTEIAVEEGHKGRAEHPDNKP